MSRDCLHFAGSLPLGQPGPEGVARRVDVRVISVTAGLTSERSVDAALPVEGAAFGASLGGVTRIYPEALPARLFRDVCEHPSEACPSRVECGTNQTHVGR